MAFKGLLVVARESGIADSAEIVTRTPWSDQAKGFAKTSGIELFTYRETQKYDISEFMNFAHPKIQSLDVDQRLVGYTSSFRGDLFWEVLFQVRDMKDLEAMRKQLSTALATTVAVYFDECERLAQEADSHKKSRKQKAKAVVKPASRK